MIWIFATKNVFLADDTGTYGLIDNLTYTYRAGNQLNKVRDLSLLDKGFKSVNNPNSTQYTYDANGNLKSDLNKGITNIEYNVLNLPQVITFTNNRQLQFVYDASGAKLRKRVLVNGVVTETRDYVNGVEYKNNILERVAHSEGAVVQNEQGAYQHEFVLRDHLGNTRVTFRDGINKGEPYDDWSNGWFPIPVDPNANNPTYNDGVVTKDDNVQINHFYPFGLNMEGDWNGAQGKNKYQYNGKEWNDDFGLGWNHHDWRFYDVALNRFVTIDPESETGDQQSWNPYHFGYDDPIRHCDPDGRFPIETFWDVANVAYDVGKLVYHGATGQKAAIATDLKDLGADVVATLTPYVPAGTTKIVRALAKTASAAGAANAVVKMKKEQESFNERVAREKAERDAKNAAAAEKEAHQAKQRKQAEEKAKEKATKTGPVGGHNTNKSEGKRNKHEEADARRQREQEKKNPKK